MKRLSVESSNVASVGYDASTATLEVEFHGGGVYQYLGVPESEYEALMGASSVGSYLNQHIKPNYRVVRV